jgi:hypothetical protein
MNAKFKKYTSVQFVPESKRIFRDVLKQPELGEAKGIILDARWDERDPDHYSGSQYIYTVEFEDGDVRDIAATHLEEVA